MEKIYSVKPKRLLIAIVIAGVLSWFAALYLMSGSGPYRDIVAGVLLVVGPATAVGAILGHPVVGLLCGITSLASMMAMARLIAA